ncbi:MAG TPA: isoprenylcysteine carboxylmethyltransferase family protein [Candidatus Competibacter sp.]|mgnify:CR=1 FL=1|nr:isoprenylcysteine carboxylmethyltransferase family protein [Candidatus Competibacteraceae bacterium]HPE73168.1 isoprenylcysteine carboxylmethyltransferase family protein [Candidatus Competibacter sp.]
MHASTSAYGLWSLVIINSLIFMIFVFSFTKPKTQRDWRTFGTFSAFLIALFTEMYGFPLTLYLLSGWLGQLNPNIDIFSHNAGHLLSTVLDLRGDPHFNGLHILSSVFIAGGLILLAAAWKVLYAAQQSSTLATTGVYVRLRHPQYSAFVLVMVGFLLQWPTLPTMIMFPILVVMYWRLALREEREVAAVFGDEYQRYTARTPRFIPKIRNHDRVTPRAA